MSVVIGREEFDPTLKLRIAHFIDEHYEAENPIDDLCVYEEAECLRSMADPQVGTASYADNKRIGSIGGLFGRKGASRERGAASAPVEEEPVFEATRYEEAALPLGEQSSLASWLDQIDEPFSTTLLALIDRKGLSDTDVYKRANMSRQLFSRIRSDADYRPAKKTVLALAIAMELPLNEMRDLLCRAGFALSRASKRDVIVEYFVTNGIYDLFAINEALYEFDQPLI